MGRPGTVVTRRNDIAAAAGGGGGVPADTVMASPWSTGLGNGDDALRDTQRTVPWSETKGTTDNTHVVTTDSTGLDWPTGMSNCMENSKTDPASVAGVRMRENLALPAVGESQFWRFYYASVYPDTFADDGTHHPFDDGTAGLAADNRHWFNTIQGEDPNGSGLIAVTWGSRTPIETSVDVWVLGPAEGAAQHWAGASLGSIDLFKGTVYRFEHQLKRISTTEYLPYAWVARVEPDGSETDLYGPEDFFLNTTTAPESGWSMADENVTFDFNGFIDKLTSRNCGSNGWQQTAESFTAWYFGGVMLRINSLEPAQGRCGAFDPEEESW